MTEEVEKKKVLGTAPIIAIAMALIGPAAYGVGFFPAMLGEGTGPVLALPILIGTVACIFTAISVAVLALKFAYSGGAYAYSREAMGVHAGFMVGWATVLAYFFLPTAGALFAGIYGDLFISSIAGVPGGTYLYLDILIAVLAALAMLFIAYRGIEAGGGTMMAVLVVQILLVFIIALWAITAVPPGVNYGAPFDPSFTSWSGAGAGDLGIIATAGFLFFFAFYGFDGTVVFAGEAKNPYRSCALGAVLCILIVGAIYVFWAWAMMLPYTGDIATFQAMANEVITVGDVSPLAAQAGIDWLGGANNGIAVLSFAMLLSALGSGTAAALTISRILHAMGTDEVMPKHMGKLHPKHKSPHMAAIYVGLTTLLIPIITYFVGVPLIDTFIFTATWCAWGVLIMYFFMNVDNLLISSKKITGKSAILGIVVPIIGAALMGYIWWSSGSAGIPGVAEVAAFEGGPFWNTMMLPGFIWLAIGVVYLIYLHTAKHEVLERGISAV
ncbi:MAG: APC family permease [Candidatus Methylarchaceae archaeon HK01M]|nr:APC family permease [Candidatus Methylarchaceae archaeon HK01M]